MKRLGACLFLLLIESSCEDRPAEAPTPAVAASERQPEPAGDLADSGPLDDQFEYAACFFAPAGPQAAVALSRKKGKRAAGDIVALRPGEFWEAEEPEIQVFVFEVTSEALLYEERRTHGHRYKLIREKETSDVDVPAMVLAAFVAPSTGIPVLYDSQSGLGGSFAQAHASSVRVGSVAALSFPSLTAKAPAATDHEDGGPSSRSKQSANGTRLW